MTPIAPDQFGAWVLGLAAIVGLVAAVVAIAVGVKKLLEQPPDQQVITRKEAEQFATRAELMDVKATIDKLQTYLQARMHELANQLAPLPTQVAVLIKQQERFEVKIDQATVRQERLLALMEPKSGVGTGP